MIYIDSNVFIFAALNREELGEKARALLKDVQEGKKAAATSALTFDEVTWKILHARGFEAALLVAQDILEMPSLILLDANASVLATSFNLMKLYRLFPRDAIHAASAINNRVFTIVSEDKDFDKVKGIKRIGIKSL